MYKNYEVVFQEKDTNRNLPDTWDVVLWTYMCTGKRIHGYRIRSFNATPKAQQRASAFAKNLNDKHLRTNNAYSNY